MMKKILVIEDDPILGKVALAAIQQLGYAVELDAEGDSYLQLLDGSRTADLVLLDMHLPLASGLDILTSLRGEPRLAGLRIIILTADLQKASLAEARGERVLLKPIGIERLQHSVQEALALT